MVITLLAAAALVLPGCGGEENGGDDGTPATDVTQTVEIRETEFALDPEAVTLDSAGTYTFHAINDGSIEHALEIEGSGVEDETESLAAGESGEVTVELQEGTYEIYCPIGNHRQQGMEGRVVVGGAGGNTTDGGTTTDDEGTTGETETGEIGTDDAETDDNSGSGSDSSGGYGY